MELRAFNFIVVILLIEFGCGREIRTQGGASGGGEAIIANEKKVEEQQGLYNSSDKVYILTANNFQYNVFNQKYARLVEFYNTYCGHCKRFAPVWKQFASAIYSWRDVVRVSAIDCADDENNEICRNYEIMAYPTLRYYPPNFHGDGFGKEFGTEREIDKLKLSLVRVLSEEQNQQPTWPNWTILSDISNIPQVDAQTTQFIFALTEPENSTNAISTMINLSPRTKEAKLFRIATNDSATSVKVLDGNKKFIANIAVNGSRPHNISREIEKFLDTQNIKPVPHTAEEPSYVAYVSSDPEYPTDLINQIKELKKSGTIFQADIEMAIKFALFHEIPSYKLTSDRILALQNFITVLAKYAPLKSSGILFLHDLRDSIVNASDELTIEVYENRINELKEKYDPIFSTNKWVGCYSKSRTLRRYPCGLWSLFHYLTIQSAESPENTDALEVLQSMHRYIKNFFGCTECAEHFIDMAARRKIWSVPSQQEAILWLWEAHNEVNNRLANDATTDKEWPKIQFPSTETCSTCRKPTSHTVQEDEIDWNKTEVLFFLKRIYAPHTLHCLETTRNIPHAEASENSSGHHFGKVLTELDMRMGIFLYLFSIVLMIVAVKFYLKRGYRKKLYVHDILGKV